MENEEIMNTTSETESNEVIEEVTEVVNEEVTIDTNVATDQTVEFHFEPEETVEVTSVKKSIFKKWWFWVTCAVVIIALVVGSICIIAAVTDDDSDSSYSYSSFVDPYVSMVKGATHSSSGREYGTAFDNFFSSPSWDHFTSTTGQEVVEFTGTFMYSNAPATARIQFVIDLEGGTFEATYLEINEEAQSRIMLATLINKVFETY